MAKHVVVVSCIDSGREALYVAGELAYEDQTIYAVDIAGQSMDGPIEFSHVTVETPANMAHYPKRFEACLPWIVGE